MDRKGRKLPGEVQCRTRGGTWMTDPDARIRQACGDSGSACASAHRMSGLASALKLASGRAAELRRRAEGEPQENEAWLRQALHALDHAHAELMAAQEELNQRADELLTARVEHELEWLRYRDLFETAPISYLETDLRGNVIEANQRACALLNVGPAGLVDRPLIVYVALADRLRFRESLQLWESRVQRSSIGLRLQPRHTCDLIAVRAEVAAVDGNLGRRRAVRWAFSEVGEVARPAEQPQPSAFLTDSLRGARRFSRRRMRPRPYARR